MLSELGTTEILEKINDEDAKVPPAVRKEIPTITAVVNCLVDRIKNGGRLVYAGAGTSGRLAVIDAAELLPTYGVGKETVRALIAGGRKAMFYPVEGIEDKSNQGRKDLKSIGFSNKDVILGISASGRTPYVLGALQFAKDLKATTVALTANPDSPITKIVHYAICARTGPEAVAGSTRMKAGTAQKLVLNMISTATMIKLGKVHGNLMVNLKPVSAKLADRQVRIVMEESYASRARAEELLSKAKGDVKVAIIMGKSKIFDYERATAILESEGGSLAKAINSINEESGRTK